MSGVLNDPKREPIINNVMRRSEYDWLHSWRGFFLCVVVFCLSFKAQTVHGAGVTIITHGFSGNVTDWIIPMAEKIPQYYLYPGSTNFSCYEIYLVQDAQGV